MNANDDRPVALVDLDGSIISYDEQLIRDMEKLRSPEEPPTSNWWRKDQIPEYIKNRMDLIRASSEWWESLSPLPDGIKMFQLMMVLGFRIVICTQGPKKNPDAWKGKMSWCIKNLPAETDVIITRDKGLIYGKVLMDDYPEYITKWLAHRPRGLVIMPDYDYNQDFSHPNVIRWDGSDEKYEEIKIALEKIKERVENE